MNILKVETLGSTNAFLKQLSKQKALQEGTVVFTENQTAGRGQQGTSWESEPGKNIACSILLYPDFLPVKQHFLLSEAISIGIKSVLDTYIKRVSIKWPNDIYYEEKKIAGILIENELMGDKFIQSVIGTGLNVNQDTFRDAIPNPVSLKQILGKNIAVVILLEAIVESILTWYEKLKAGETAIISAIYHASLYRKGFNLYKDANGQFLARIDRVSDDGYLHLITAKEEARSYAFKEVSLLPYSAG
ncbi:MAG: biotin--[acetyl-CoA-carboxylase] ligase [Dysgonamonadaceae bacterium]|jgi:BirA family biotin operon repressor/biotin-[acetyl-CoA-carboxylase] ligase|nr:biotin--[acetyl-CoA-carboxylase] ligase [Dysgonamonadaceae bacterium]